MALKCPRALRWEVGGIPVWAREAPVLGAGGSGTGNNSSTCSRALSFEVKRLNIMSSEHWKLD